MAKEVVNLDQNEMGQKYLNLLVFLNEQELEYLDMGTHFVVAVPKLKVQEKSVVEVPKKPKIIS